MCGTYGTGVWKEFLMIEDSMMYLVGYGVACVGDRTRVWFWHDKWCEEVLLQDRFPRLFLVAMERGGVVADSMEWVGDVILWRPNL